jgi:hypothetical protein
MIQKSKRHAIIRVRDTKNFALLIVMPEILCHMFWPQTLYTLGFMVFSSFLKNLQTILLRPIIAPLFIGVENLIRGLNAYEMLIYK